MYGESLYSTLIFGTEGIDTTSADEPINLIKYLPPCWQDIKEMKGLQKTLSIEVGSLKKNTRELSEQLFISTSTWGLDLWEREFGLQIDYSKPYESRREIILAKLRGAGTTTKGMIKSVAMAFSGGEVEINEYPEEYRFVIQFIGVKGIPPNMAGLIRAIEDIKPAHLVYSFKYTYTTWNMVTGLTWAGSINKTWSELRTFEGE